MVAGPRRVERLVALLILAQPQVARAEVGQRVKVLGIDLHRFFEDLHHVVVAMLDDVALSDQAMKVGVKRAVGQYFGLFCDGLGLAIEQKQRSRPQATRQQIDRAYLEHLVGQRDRFLIFLVVDEDLGTQRQRRTKPGTGGQRAIDM